jgi:sec-independent protein translocase protein TatB
MFDIGFSELVVCAVVALIVIGPERLPRVARTAGHLFGRLQRYVNDVKADISREMELDELRRLQSEVKDAARSIEESVTRASRDFETGVRGVEHDLNTAGAAPAPSGGDVGASAAGLPELTEPPPSDTPAAGSSGAPGTPPPAPARQAALPGFEQA